MDRKYFWPMDLYLTPEQTRHEIESSWKIVEKYRMSNTGILGTCIVGVGGATFLAMKGRGVITKALLPTLIAGLTKLGIVMPTFIVSVFFQMIIIKLILNFRT